MKVIVFSYSFTGNNEALATSVAAEFAAKHVKIIESKPRTNNTIIFDVLFNRTPQINPIVDKVEDYDLVIFVGPVWMEKVATPLRACFNHCRSKLGKYAFVSLSGGSVGTNPKLPGDLLKRVGKEPVALIDLHIADLLPPDPKPTMKDTGAYRLNDKDKKSLTNTIVKKLRETVS